MKVDKSILDRARIRKNKGTQKLEGWVDMLALSHDEVDAVVQKGWATIDEESEVLWLTKRGFEIVLSD